MNLAPIVLFVYNRLEHTKLMLASLQNNELAAKSELIVYSDAPKDENAIDAVFAVRKYLKTINGFKNVIIIEGRNNLGPAKAIISGVTEVIARFEKIIVLEDDLVVSRFFLKFMNDAVSFYKNEAKVISVGSYMYPNKAKSKETFFLRIPDTWGWATWKRGWDLFESNGEKLLDILTKKNMLRRFNLDGAFDYTKMLKQHIEGKRDSWGIRWIASAILADKLSLYPVKSLVRNIGFDKSGTNCGFLNGYDAGIAQNSVNVASIPLEENKDVVRAIGNFHRIRKLKYLPRIFLKNYLNK